MQNKNQNIEVLNTIYKSSKLGVDSISNMLPKVKNDELKKELASQLLGYNDFIKKSTEKLHEVNHAPHEPNPAESMISAAGIAVKTMVDASESHIAEMVIEGSTMGVVEMQKKINSRKNLNDDILQLGSDIISFERQNIDNMRSYL